MIFSVDVSANILSIRKFIVQYNYCQMQDLFLVNSLFLKL
jgi:hypothetical protein